MHAMGQARCILTEGGVRADLVCGEGLGEVFGVEEGVEHVHVFELLLLQRQGAVVRLRRVAIAAHNNKTKSMLSSY